MNNIRHPSPAWGRQAHAARRRMVARLVIALLVWMGWVGGLQPAHAAPTRAVSGAATGDTAAAPLRLRIPALDIDAPVVAVGQTADGKMAAPTRIADVAWYNAGALPGEPGNAVMAGHLDDSRGRPAVFGRLADLAPGDSVFVDMADGITHHFAVIEVADYPADAAPLTRIFGLDFERDLNLITCDGAWNQDAQRYERRLVVYTRLVRPDSAPGTPPAAPIVAPTGLTLDHAAPQARPASARPPAPSAGPADARQDRHQPPASRGYLAGAL